jgi:DNA-binding response OmpR family regulator
MSESRLLVIEDNEGIAALVSRIALEIGFDVRATHNFADTPTLYDEFVPDIIVLDIVMPEIDGMEILKLLHKRNSSSRIVILSGEAQYRPMASTLGAAYGLNIDAVVAKPFRVVELRDALKKIYDQLLAHKEVSLGEIV